MVTPALMQARQLPSALGAGRLGPVSGLMDQNMTAAGIEQLRKTAGEPAPLPSLQWRVPLILHPVL